MAVCFFLANNSDASLALKLKSNKDTGEEENTNMRRKMSKRSVKK